MKKKRFTTVALSLVIVLTNHPHASSKTSLYSRLQKPSYLQISSIKVFPDRKIYALSVRESQLVVFNLDGSILKEIDILAKGPVNIKYYLFDFFVDKDGEIYVLAVWRDAPQQTHSGVFRFDSSGNFRNLVNFKKHVDGRKMIVVGKNIVVLGLDNDFYFDKSKPINLLHSYSLDGDYLGSFFEVDPHKYLTPGESRTTMTVYHNLRPLVDKTPIGFHEVRGIFSIVPGTHIIEFYDPYSQRQKEKVHLTPPAAEDVNIPPRAQQKLGRLSEVDMEIVALQVGSTSVTAEFNQVSRYEEPRGQVRTKVRAIYELGGTSPNIVQKVTAADGVLIPQVGISSGRIFTFSSDAGQSKVMVIE